MMRRRNGPLAAMARHRGPAGPLAEAIDHFCKVSRSYRLGLFPCYTVADPPRTNNDLEQLFDAYRRHERHVTGRKSNSSATVLHGPVRIIAALASRLIGRRPTIRPAPTGSAGGRCAPAWSAVAMPACCAPSFAALPEAYLSRLERLLCQPALSS